MNVNLAEVSLLLPILIPALGSLLILMLEVGLKGMWPKGHVTAAILVATIAGVKVVFDAALPGQTILNGMIFHDPFALYFALIIAVTAAITLLMAEGRLKDEGIIATGEFYALYLMATSGAIMFVAAAELITLFLALEIMSMALYCLCGSALRYRRSSESALKYFFLGSFSSAFLLFGVALLYGLTGSTEIVHIASNLDTVSSYALAVAVGFLLVGLIFKVGVVPFHFWTPDVYQGAPTPVTAFMACTIKAAAVGAALRVMWMLFIEDFMHYEIWSGVVWLVALSTMVLGNIVALRQRSLKRMLAYSSVGHAGYMMMAFLAPMTWGGGEAILFYLVGYAAMTLGAFGVVLAVTSKAGDSKDGDDITTMNRLGYSHPLLAAAMTLFMLSLCGLPPGMIGLLGKFYIFSSAVKAGYVGLAIVGVLCSAISCYYYLRVVVAMYFIPETNAADEPVATVNFSLAGALSICALSVVFLGLFPSMLHQNAKIVIESLF